MNPKMHSNVLGLEEQYQTGRITRREFIRRAAFLGLSMSTISAFLASCAAPPSGPTSAPMLTSAPGPTATSIPAPTATPAGPYGELNIGVTNFSQESFDPAKMNRFGLVTMLAPMFDSLTMTDRSSASRKVSIGIAERWETAPDGLSWTFYVRKGIKFHNGDDLTAKDVKFSLDHSASKDALEPFTSMQDHVEVLDDYTVRVFTKGMQPYYWNWVNDVDGQYGMITPKEYIEKNGYPYFDEHPVGTGPFRFVRHVRGDRVEYEALDKHYRQVPVFKKVTIMAIPEEATRVAMLKTGALDAIEMAIDSVPEVEAAGLRTVPVAGNPANVFFLGALDPRAKGMPIADTKVREALSLAINRDEIGRTLFYGKMLSPMPPCMLPDQPEIDVPYWREQAAKIYRYDPEEATRLLKEAGYPQGFTIKLYSYILPGASYLSRLAPVIQGYWLKIGVKTEIVPIEYATFRPMVRSGPNSGPSDTLLGQACLHAGAGNVMPGKNLLNYFSSKGTFGLVAKANPELDRLIDGSLGEMDEAKRKDVTAKAIQLTVDSRAASSLGTVPGQTGLGPRIEMGLPTGGLLSVVSYIDGAKHGKL